MWGCVCLCICTQSSHVSAYILTCRHTEFDVCVRIFTYKRTESTCVGVCGCVNARRVYMCTYIYLRIYTQSLHVRVYTFPYIHTEFTCVCVYIYVYAHRVCLGVCVYLLTYMHTEFTCLHVYVHIFTYIHTGS